MGTRLVTSLLVLLAGCSSGPVTTDPEQPESPHVKIDSSLSVALQDNVAAAASKWIAHGFSVEVSVAPSSEANVLEGPCPERAAGCAWPGERVHLVLSQLDACNWAKVDGITVCERMSFEFMILHELGHFLGIEYHLPDGNVMQEGATVPMPPAELTDADVGALRAAWPQAD